MRRVKIALTVCVLFALLCWMCGCDKFRTRKYAVEVTFCDKRPPAIYIVKSAVPPSNDGIESLYLAVPKWRGLLNVCNVRTIKEIK